jgi:hypothetical protein
MLSLITRSGGYDPALPSTEGFCRNDSDITSAIAKRFETAPLTFSKVAYIHAPQR